jgi:hypothetical protein
MVEPADEFMTAAHIEPAAVAQTQVDPPIEKPRSMDSALAFATDKKVQIPPYFYQFLSD